MSKPLLAVTAGEPGGIGPDLMVALAHHPPSSRCVVFADPDLIARRAHALDTEVQLIDYDPNRDDLASGSLEMQAVDLPGAVRPGVADPAHAHYVLRCIETAGKACLTGAFDGLVTGPVQKSALLEAGIDFYGHTEYLAKQSDTSPVMLLASGDFRVALVTTHMPLAEVAPHITRDRVRGTLEVLLDSLHERFGIEQPTVEVLGLNPHAGESGHLGREELNVLVPVIEQMIECGHRVRGPVSADTAFVDRTGIDAWLAMYHDQGLPVIKTQSFGNIVNITLGLPYVRTSVDHGTALTEAGTGRADANSLFAAIESAARQVERFPRPCP